MGEEVLTQQGCWQIFDQWTAGGQVAWAEEPRELGRLLRESTQDTATSPKAWMDAYLGAFAESGGLTLVTLDRALAGKARGAVLLG